MTRTLVHKTGKVLLLATAAVVCGQAVALAAGGGGHGEGHLEDHWSLYSLFPALQHNVAGMLGHGVISGEPATRVAHIFSALLAAIIAIGLGVAAAKKFKDPDKAVVPDTKLSPATFFEIIVGGVFGMMEGMMGREKARATYPIVAALAVFILISNLMGLIPGLLPPTDNLNLTLAMGTCVFFLTHYFGLKYNGVAYLKHFLGPVQAWYALPLMLLMLFIELISHIVRPVSLGLRLMGNMMGDHTVLGIFLGFNLLFVPLPLMALGLLVSIVQTLVFCLLSMVYFSMAVEDLSHH
jgi:F-type H+-transporting ATPase subunit a